MTARLRYGVIGTGMMGIEHLRNLALLPGAEVVAYADPHEESRRWARLVTGPAPAEHSDYRALLDDPRVDAVVIVTPNHTHRAVLEDAFATRKHILIEKPLCTTVEDARLVVERAARHPAVVWTAMEYRYMPPVARLIDEIRKGTIGQLRMFAIREHRFPSAQGRNWNRFSRNTGGTLVEKCCHFFDLMRLTTRQRPTRVYASGGQDVNHLDERYGGERPDILDNGFVTVNFESGARALLDLCMFAEGSTNQEEIAATGDPRRSPSGFVPESKVVPAGAAAQCRGLR
jgi:predicted dehydrogenase